MKHAVASAQEPRTKEELAAYGNHIVQYSPEYSLCAGCETCAIMCGLTHYGCTGPNTSGIKVNLGTRSCIHTIEVCLQCKDHPCYEACPKKDKAMCIDEETGVVYIVEGECIGCGLCARSCRFTPSRIHIRKNKVRKLWKAVKCDLCRGNEDGPQCVAYCPVRCIGLSDDAIFSEDGTRPAELDDAVAPAGASAPDATEEV